MIMLIYLIVLAYALYYNRKANHGTDFKGQDDNHLRPC